MVRFRLLADVIILTVERSSVVSRRFSKAGTASFSTVDGVGAHGYGAAVDSEDVVEPVDALLQEVLAAIAERTADSERRDAIIDLILTNPPFREWPAESRERLVETCEYVKRVAHEMRQRASRPVSADVD